MAITINGPSGKLVVPGGSAKPKVNTFTVNFHEETPEELAKGDIIKFAKEYSGYVIQQKEKDTSTHYVIIGGTYDFIKNSPVLFILSSKYSGYTADAIRVAYVNVNQPYYINYNLLSSSSDLLEIVGIDELNFDSLIPSINTTPVNKKDYPHKCTKCGSPAYIGFMKVDCSRGCR